jgi:hypothetical protein
MKALKIELSNKSAIESELHAINGRATAHSYTSFNEIEAIAKRFEGKVYDLLCSKKEMVGAIVRSESGSSVAKKYKGSRVSTIVTIERKSTGWYLTDVKSGQLWTDGGRDVLTLTAQQDARAVEQFRKSYNN